ncbi:hypothetical protein FNV62_52140 [Streptomyces sp. RLB3-17]|nr:hypothetical protein FNV67_53255 [Streptomyces sp. S1D4-20]QDN72861.1 hypothetical protein FNV66_52120 [Streptomyces sp. S1D4-14]QDO03564.1 hypothetical protein FNV58_53735 [Streptomyces sp. RLB1-9]QDO25295.1 hypothetical protein FNV65_52310 [Streptomyces sp. S1A1-8]QDO35416.1 hypothetical protein FNV63_52335 [Streptomyces sp. S1A1-3]QDO45437.1 hypothetical protein FNV62_52140 [Streptomyces sp. RLB3-17]QDO55386.1 hypothetical protein FNV60_50990 [Streptomyces sp. RLB3-5]QDO65563.1 hypothe
MTGRTRLWRHTCSLTGWWLLLALALWLLGQAVDQAASLTACAASSAFLVGIGETGDWLRRRWAARRERAGTAAKRSRSRYMQR